MKLRYLHLRDYPPMKDIKVLFASGSPLQRECAIRFVVGVNGSGKSNLLRAVTEVFLTLSDLRVPHFPVSLIYELGVRGSANYRTLVLDCPGSRSSASLWVTENFIWPDESEAKDFETSLFSLRKNAQPTPHDFIALIAPGDWPSRAATPPLMALPSAVLAYTTGTMQPWQVLWTQSQDSNGVELVSQEQSYDPSDERPAGWTVALESATQMGDHAAARGITTPSNANHISASNLEPQNQFRRPILLTPTLLKCALLAVALPEAFLLLNSDHQELRALIARAFRKNYEISPLQALLERGGWHYLVSVAFRTRLQSKSWSRTLCETAHDWLLCAGEVIAEPHPSELLRARTLFFDLKGEFSGYVDTLGTYDGLETCSTQGEALLTLLGGVKDTTAFERFMKLFELHQAGLFDDIDLRLRRKDKPDEALDLDENEEDFGVLRFEELSDGEQMVLGRMALFYLLEGQHDALLLLDEPETHFNDKWKREIVDIIDNAIGRNANDVLISTHSAIVLSDVFNDEIVMVQKTPDGSSNVRAVEVATFATDPSALMMTVFGADDTIGKRAQEFIDKELAQATGTPEQIANLERLIERMGSGFYRSELRTLLNTWRENNG